MLPSDGYHSFSIGQKLIKSKLKVLMAIFSEIAVRLNKMLPNSLKEVQDVTEVQSGSLV